MGYIFVFLILLAVIYSIVCAVAGFGPAGEGYFRLSAFNSRANIEEAIGRIQRAFH